MVEKAASRPWTQEEDDLLRKAVATHGAQDNWKAVATEVPGRTNKACRKRWLHSLSPTIKKTPWTQDEDDQLLGLFSIHGPKWSFIARQIPGRTDDACSKRYNEALNPDLKKDDWTPEEEQLLVQVHAEIGHNKWKEVGARLSRSGLACRNRWKQLERKGKISQLIAPGGAHREMPARPMGQLESYYPYYPPESYPLFNEAGPMSSFREPTPELPASQPVSYPPPMHFSSSSLIAALSDPTPQPSPSSSYLEPPADSSCGSSPIAQHSPMLSESPYQASPAEITDNPMLLDNLAQNTFLGFDFSSFYMAEEPFVSHEPGIFTTPLDPSSGAYSMPDQEMCVQVPKAPIVAQLEEAPLYDRQAGSPFSDISPEMNLVEMSSASCSPEERLSQLSPTSSPGSAAPVDLPANDSIPSSSLLFAETPLVTDAAVSRGRKRKNTASASTAHTLSVSNIQHRLSTIMPLSSDRSIKPYACGHQECWPATEETSKACFATSRELWEHSRAAHVDDFQDDRPFRCALPGCGKSWKSLNGIQYHLQVSTAHFQQAVSSQFSAANASDSPQTDSDMNLASEGQETGKRYTCDHPNCYKTYKNASGLRYHKKNGHPRKLPMQLTNMPPSLARDLPLRIRKMRKKDDLQQVS